MGTALVSSESVSASDEPTGGAEREDERAPISLVSEPNDVTSLSAHRKRKAPLAHSTNDYEAVECVSPSPQPAPTPFLRSKNPLFYLLLPHEGPCGSLVEEYHALRPVIECLFGKPHSWSHLRRNEYATGTDCACQRKGLFLS